MSALGIESIEHTVELSHKGINDLDARLGWHDKHRRLLRTVLQALRDWLSVNAAANFGAELPELLRGIYYERWRPVATPVKQRRKAVHLPGGQSVQNGSHSLRFRDCHGCVRTSVQQHHGW
jgi:Uncharacterized conserved protein (DUF2267)